jgi:hypothetical protein
MLTHVGSCQPDVRSGTIPGEDTPEPKALGVTAVSVCGAPTDAAIDIIRVAIKTSRR